MSTNRLTRRIVAALACAALAGAVHAQATEPMPLAAFAGDVGYQEVPLDGSSWYLAFHGTRKHALGQVQAGWWARAVQLCESAHKPFIVQLRYVGEPVYEEEPLARYDDDFSTLRVPAGAVYIPIFIPSGPRNIPPSLTPTQAAVVRCVDRTTGLRTGRKALSFAEARQEARNGGVTVP